MSVTRMFIDEEKGTTVIEYGLLAALISIAITGGVALTGQKLCATFDSVGQTVATAASLPFSATCGGSSNGGSGGGPGGGGGGGGGSGGNGGGAGGGGGGASGGGPGGGSGGGAGGGGGPK